MEKLILIFVPMLSLGNAKTKNNIFKILKYIEVHSKISCKYAKNCIFMVSSVLRYCITS